MSSSGIFLVPIPRFSRGRSFLIKTLPSTAPRRTSLYYPRFLKTVPSAFSVFALADGLDQKTLIPQDCYVLSRSHRPSPLEFMSFSCPFRGSEASGDGKLARLCFTSTPSLALVIYLQFVFLGQVGVFLKMFPLTTSLGLPRLCPRDC